MKATASRRREVGRKPEIKTVSLRKERTYKANDSDKVAQHTDVQGSGLGVNGQGFTVDGLRSGFGVWGLEKRTVEG